MKQAFCILILFSFCLILWSQNNTTPDSVNVNSKKITLRNITKHNEVDQRSKIDSMLFTYWKEKKQVLTKTNNILFNKHWLEDKVVNLKGQKYFLISDIPTNWPEINDGERVDIYTMFNVVYSVEKKLNFWQRTQRKYNDLPKWKYLAASGSLSLITAIMWPVSYGSYVEATRSTDAEKYRQQTMTWEITFPISFAWLCFEAYKYNRNNNIVRF